MLAAAGAGADLRERGRVGPRDRGLRGDAGAQRGRRSRTVELLSRIAEIEERRLSHQNAAFDVYGRALRVDPTNQDVLAHLERLAAETGALGQAGDAVRERAGEDRRTAPRDRSAAAPRAHLRGGDRPGRRGDRDLPARHRRPTPTARTALVALDRLYARAQQWDELAEVVRAARSGVAPPTRSASRSTSGSRRSTSWRWSTCRRPSRPIARS